MGLSSITGQNLCVELAILQKDVKSNNPGSAPFAIPALMTEQYKGMKFVNNYNVINKRKTSTPSVSTLTIDNQVVLDIPKEYTRYYGSLVVPKGTKFIVAFIGGEINSIRIIGRYDGKNGNGYDELTQLPIATTDSLGGIIVGDGLAIDKNGVLRNISKPIPDSVIDEWVNMILSHKPDGGGSGGTTTIVKECDCKPIPDSIIDNWVDMILSHKPTDQPTTKECDCKPIPDSVIDEWVKQILAHKPSGGGSSGDNPGGGTVGTVKYSAIDLTPKVKNYKLIN